MADFAYVAITKDGKQKKGSMEAKDEQRVNALLKEKGMIPISVTEQGTLTKDINFSFGSPVKTKDLSIFCRQFCSILNAGVTIIDALDMLSDQTENKAFKKAIKSTQAAVQKGETLADAMRINKIVFPPILVNMVEAGEASGSLEKSFDRMATQFEKSSRLKAKVKGAMIYPIAILVIAFAVVIIMSVAVIPIFTDMFSEMGSELPFMTQLVVNFSDFLLGKWYLVLAGFLLLVFGIRSFAITEQGKLFFGGISIKMPLFGKLIVKNASASFARTLATLVASGISISEALEITSRSMKNVLFQKVLEEAKREVERGVSLSEPIRRSGLFPSMISHMLKIGEETGNIEGMLTKAAEYYEEEVEAATANLSSMMQPIVIVVMGVIVAFLVLALYQPMISMYSDMGSL